MAVADPLTDEQLAEIEAACAAATAGPWKLDDFQCYFFAPDGMVFDMHDPLRYSGDISAKDRAYLESQVMAIRLRGTGAEVSGRRPKGSQMANARIVELASTQLAALVAEVRRLRAELGMRNAVLPITAEIGPCTHPEHKRCRSFHAEWCTCGILLRVGDQP